MLIPIYRAVSSVVRPFALPFIRRGHEIGYEERRGIYEDAKLQEIRDAAGAERSNVWLHAVSVGETQAASSVALAARASGYDRALTVSTVTVTGAKAAGDLIGGAMTAHVYAPWDFPVYTRRAVDTLAPSVYAAAESEIWPSLLYDLYKRQIPAVLFNARVSDRTWARRGFAGTFYRAVLPLFRRILARSASDSDRLVELGARSASVSTVGDLKIDAIVARTERVRGDIPDVRRRLRLAPDARLAVAGSTHEGEDTVVISAWSILRKSFPGLRLVIAPRHPERAAAVRDLASRFGTAELWSETPRGTDADIVVIDTIGTLFTLYGASDAAVVGGSFVPRGGQNIVEPAAWGTPCAHGPHMEDFAEATVELDASGNAASVRDEAELAGVWRTWLSAPRVRAAASNGYIRQNTGVARRVWETIYGIAQQP